VPIISYYIQTGKEDSSFITTKSVKFNDIAKPDIYYIVLDSYSRDDILKDMIGFDNSNFLNSLRERGFFIPKCAYSNYDSTARTIASVLNLQYLDTLGVPIDFSDETHGKTTNLILHSQIIQLFKEYGYQTVTDEDLLHPMIF
jgi:hypothetical protein